MWSWWWSGDGGVLWMDRVTAVSVWRQLLTSAALWLRGLTEPSGGPPQRRTSPQHRNGTAGTEDLPRVLTVITFTSSSSPHLRLPASC